MRIAINSRLLIPNKMEGLGWYTYEITKRLVQNHPEHEFFLFFDRPFDDSFNFGTNATNIVLKPQARHPILFKIWFDRSVSRALKKYKVDLFFSPDGYLSLKSDVKQVATIHDLNFEHNPEDLPSHFLKYFKKNFPLFAQKASHVITVSDYSKQDIVTTYKIPEEKITSIWNGCSDKFKPISDDKKNEVENRFSNGNPYFLFVGALHPRKNLKRLISAYIELRKNNPDNPFHLVIVGEALWKNSTADLSIPAEIKSFIHFTGRLSMDELVQVTGAASVLTFVPYFEGFGIPLAEAMKCGVPILAGNLTSLPEVAGEAALYCNPLDVTDITEKLVEISQNEPLRRKLSEIGLNRSELFSWDRAADETWNVLEKELSIN